MWFLDCDRLPAETIHSDKNQFERDEMIAKFKRANTMLLVATDVAQRGLDVKGVSHVINFDLPDRIDDYVHRIGGCLHCLPCRVTRSDCCAGRPDGPGRREGGGDLALRRGRHHPSEGAVERSWPGVSRAAATRTCPLVLTVAQLSPP